MTHTYTGPLAKQVLAAGVLPDPCKPQPPEGYTLIAATLRQAVFATDENQIVLVCPCQPGDVVEFCWRIEDRPTRGFWKPQWRTVRRRIVSVEPVDVQAWLPVPTIPGFNFGITAELRQAYLAAHPDKPWSWLCELEEKVEC